MLIKANIKEAYRSLRNSKQRTLLAIIGIVIGIGSVICMVSIGMIVQNEVMKDFKDMGINLVTVRSESVDQMKSIPFSLDDIRDLAKRSGTVLAVAPYISSSARINYRGKEEYIYLLGVDGSYFTMDKLTMHEGRSISDLDEYRNFCVIGKDIAELLQSAGCNTIVGEKFTFGGHIYTVVGILDRLRGNRGFRSGDPNNSVIVPITTATRAFANRNITEFTARVDIDKRPPEVKAEISSYFAGKDKRYRLRINTAEERIDNMKKQMRMFTLLLGVIGSISLIVGGIGVMNVMLTSVLERKKEIGIRRALGAQQRDIYGQFIVESFVLCLTGGVAGIALGVGGSYLFAHFSHYEFLVSYAAIFLGLTVSTFVGVFFGFFPARQAAGLDPITALRA